MTKVYLACERYNNAYDLDSTETLSVHATEEGALKYLEDEGHLIGTEHIVWASGDGIDMVRHVYARGNHFQYFVREVEVKP